MNVGRLLRAAGSARTVSDLDAILQAWAERDREQDRYNRARAHGVALGLYEWFSLNHPHQAIDEMRTLQEDEYRVEGMQPWAWLRLHKLECFHHKPKSARPLCGARTRAGGECQARTVAARRRCRMHGGTSTGPRSEAGREAIRESNRRRAAARAQAAST